MHFYTSLASGGGYDFPTFLINPCQHVVFDRIIRVPMITLNMRINISFYFFQILRHYREDTNQTIYIGPIFISM